MRRPWQTWLAFGLCLGVVLAAMAWVSLTALRADRARSEARRQAMLEENLRLALWRMDSAVAPLIGREGARPYFAYTSFYPATRAYTKMFEQIQSGEVLLPSPLLTELPPNVLLHFQLEPGGDLTSPQAPTGNMRDLAETGYTTGEKIRLAAARLTELRDLVKAGELLTALVLDTARVETAQVPPEALPPAQNISSQIAQQLRSNVEYAARQQSQRYAQQETTNAAEASAAAMTTDLMRPVWVGDTLLLAREVTIEKKSYIQGCWLDWPAIRRSLLESVRDLLPEAVLEGVRGGAHAGASERLLAALPVRLIPGELGTSDATELSPILLSLAVGWFCVLLGAGAVAVLLSGEVSLSERRGAFVSAVTHELRTPLTTFRMYTEMLEGGMVKEEASRKRYLGTLRSEAERLSHLVENVLAYARLENGTTHGHIATVTLTELLDRARSLLSTRTGQAGMELVVEIGEREAQAGVRADSAAVEQILFNLVDNACKYAASASDRRIHLRTALKGSEALLSVCDHGCGISRKDARRLFRPFSKSARDAAESAPGVGLGLALSRRLARQMHGDLRIDCNVSEGACFVLILPLA